MIAKKCEKCKGTGQYMYDENHIKPCEICCTHYDGWRKITAKTTASMLAKKGCGTAVDKHPNMQDVASS